MRLRSMDFDRMDYIGYEPLGQTCLFASGQYVVAMCATGDPNIGT